MLCHKCKTERAIEDFFGKEICYKCEYKRKKKERKLYRRCKNCKGVLPPGRWTYCSDECSRIAKNANKHWTAKIKKYDGHLWFESLKNVENLQMEEEK